MTHSRHHGRHSFEGKKELTSREAYKHESEGRFGRMFKDLSPLYVHPEILRKIGKKDGPMDGNSGSNRTDSVPLGMIFFGQFIDHDITFDTSSNFTEVNAPEKIKNDRTPSLDLDNIFGGGPEQSPYLYEDGDDIYEKNGRGFYLWTGKTNNNYGQGEDEEKHDLMRNSSGTALIGDPRNDENRIISQMQLAIIRFYNVVYYEIKQEEEKKSKDRKSAKKIYEEARQIVTWHYQWIVVNEFLPSLCGQKIVDQILGEGRKWYDPKKPMIPVEFSVGAYRFGHSMIAQKMHI